MQASPENAFHVQIDHQQVLLETLSPGQERSSFIEDEAITVEDQLVLAAYKIGVADDGAVVGRPSRQHLLSGAPLSRVIGRRIDVHDDLGARQSLIGRWPHGVPDVFAYVDAHADAVDDVDRRLGAGPKVAVLVEDAVVGQVLFVVDPHQAPVVDYGGSIMDVAGLVDEPDDGRDALALGYQRLELGQIVVDELRFEEQVLHRIAGQGHLRKGDEVCAQGASLVDSGEDAAGVPLQVSHRTVYLGHSQTHRLH